MNNKIVICWIGIGDYACLFEDFYKSFKSNFCRDMEKTFFIFTDDKNIVNGHDDCIAYEVSNPCLDKDFILFRKFKYLLMAEDRYLNYDYVCFANGNLICINEILRNEIINDKLPLTCVTHGWCDQTFKKGSVKNQGTTAEFIPSENVLYKQAGFFVVTSYEFLKFANTIESWRMLDKINGTDVKNNWHDEDYVNRYYYENSKILNVLPGWKYLNPFNNRAKEVKILAYNKENAFKKSNKQFQAGLRHKDLYIFDH